jgi:hypothetical protein
MWDLTLQRKDDQVVARAGGWPVSLPAGGSRNGRAAGSSALDISGGLVVPGILSVQDCMVIASEQTGRESR